MVEVLVFGGINSVVYAMLSLGFALVFGVARVLNLFHGSFYALSAYGAYILSAQLGVPVIVTAVLCVVIVAAFGAAYDRVFIQPMRASPLAILMITLTTALFVEQILLLVFGSQALSVEAIVSGPVEILGLNVSAQRVLTAGVGVVAIAALWCFLNLTRFGAAVLAVSQDPEGARYVGIPSNRIFTLVFAISAGLAALAGVLSAPFLAVQPAMHLLPLVKAFAIVIIGGMGSLGGAILASFVIAYVETYIAFFVSSTLSELVALVAVFLVLIVRPQGFFGKRIN